MTSQRKRVVAFDDYSEVSEQTPFEETRGSFSRSDSETMHSIADSDQEKIDDGKLVSDAINQNLSSFNPDMMIEQMTRNFTLAKNLYGESIMRRISGYDANYIRKNIRIPEFRRQLLDRLAEKVEKLKQNEVLGPEGEITEKGYDLAGLVLYMEELDNLVPRGLFGEKVHKRSFAYGDKTDARNFRKGDRFRDVSLRKSVKAAAKRRHRSLGASDLVVMERKGRGKLAIVYALDASGSMRGMKMEICKKAGIALAYKAIAEKDEVGLLAFGSDIKERVFPTSRFDALLRTITRIRASMQTNIAETIRQSIGMFPQENSTRHLILLTDALPTYGNKPEEETLEAVSLARNAGITLSLIGINLDDKGVKFARKIVETGDGKFYVVKNLKELDKIVLEDYYAMI
jgi:Mg-chelatase subunit ChlD